MQDDSKINRDNLEYFLGSNFNTVATIGPILMIMFLIQYLKKVGFSKKPLSNFENTGGCVARLILNKDIERAVGRICEEQERLSEQHCNYVIKVTEEKLDKAAHANLKLETTKKLINDYMEIKIFKKKAIFTYKKVLRLMQSEVFRISKSDIDDFWFRNFSSKVHLNLFAIFCG